MNAGIKMGLYCILVSLSGVFACTYAPITNTAESSAVSGQSYDSCDYYKLVVKGSDKESDYDSILSELKKTVYKSKELEKSILFQQAVSSSPEIVYLHSTINGTVWTTNVTCNQSNLPSRTVQHLIKVSEELLAGLHAKYNFKEIYFYCSVF
jgi:hypothetical protein